MVDNIFIDPATGHMWVAVFPRPLNVGRYILDRSHPVEGRVLHISLSEDNTVATILIQVEEVFETDAGEFGLGAVTVRVYCGNKLFMGTIGLNLMFCVNPCFDFY